MAHLALYRKYRPNNFFEVIGQDNITQILKNQILSDRIGHAYLFAGIRGTGKTSIAKIFARAMNCTNTTDGNPCGKCENCQQIGQTGVMDIIEIDAASNRGVDEIRDIRDKVIYPPKIGRYKVYIIDEVHMLTKEAFNALLKTLEEPPTHVVFILATTEPNKLPATILSRCQRFDIRPISKEMIAEQLTKILKEINIEMESEAINLIAERGDHSLRDALSILDQAIDIRQGKECIKVDAVLNFLGMTNQEMLIKLVQGLIQEDSTTLFDTLNRICRKGTDNLLLMNQVIDALRQLIIIKSVGDKASEVLEKSETDIQLMRKIGDGISITRLYEMIDSLITDRQKMRHNDLSYIIMEMALLKLCKNESNTELVVNKPMEFHVKQGKLSKIVSEEKSESVNKKEKSPLMKKSETQKIDTEEEYKKLNKNKVKGDGSGDMDYLQRAKAAIDSWKKDQDFFTTQIVTYGMLKNCGNNYYEMVFQAPEHNMYAEMFNGRIQNQVQEVISKALNAKIGLKVSCTQKEYEEMDMIEKTAAIVGDEYRKKIQVTD